MSGMPDQELIAVMLELAPYLCVSKIKDYHTAMGTGAPKVHALWVAADVSTGSFAGKSGSIDQSTIPMVHGLHWLWCHHEQWTVDYHVHYRRERQAFPSKQEAVAFLKNRIQVYWTHKLTFPQADIAQLEALAESPPPADAEPRRP